VADVDAAGIGSTAAGIVFLYAAIKGISVLAALTAIVRGKSPAGLPQSNPITGGGASPAAAAASGASAIAAPVSDPDFAAAVLSGIGAPATSANVSSIESWIGREGGGGANNPLNTTFPLGGSTALAGNPDGVQNYPTYADGVDATVSTLENGSYGDILLLLRSGAGLCGRQLAGLATWSGGVANGGYSEVC
jgi:hypothetical protein